MAKTIRQWFRAEYDDFVIVTGCKQPYTLTDELHVSEFMEVSYSYTGSVKIDTGQRVEVITFAREVIKLCQN